VDVSEKRTREDQELLKAACARTASYPHLRPVFLHYALARYGDNGLQLLHVPLGFGEEALVLFSSWETARRYYLSRRHFLSEVFSSEWEPRACSAGELVSLLLGPYEGLEWVLLAPQPGARVTAGSAQANLMSRERFVEQLLEQALPVPP
jgi:hypothetical protein